jgi:hypothetical protein
MLLADGCVRTHNIPLEPDIRIDITFSGYAAGRDPILTQALAMAK